MKDAASAGYLAVEPSDQHGGWFDIQITKKVWQDSGTRPLFPGPDELLPCFGRLVRLPQLMVPRQLLFTDRVSDDARTRCNRKRSKTLEITPPRANVVTRKPKKHLPATATLVAWIARVRSLGQRAEIKHTAYARLLHVRPETIKRSVESLHDAKWCRIMSNNGGRSVVEWGGRQFWRERDVEELRCFTDCNPQAAVRLLSIVGSAPSTDCAQTPADAPGANSAPSTNCAQNQPGNDASDPGGAPETHTMSCHDMKMNECAPDVRATVEREARAICRGLRSTENLKQFMPLCWAALVQQGRLSKNDLWRAIENANNHECPPRALTVAVNELTGLRVGAQLAKDLLPQAGIEWNENYRAAVPPEASADSAARTTRLVELIERLLCESRRRRQSAVVEVDAEFLAKAKAHHIPETLARARIDGSEDDFHDAVRQHIEQEACP